MREDRASGRRRCATQSPWRARFFGSRTPQGQAGAGVAAAAGAAVKPRPRRIAEALALGHRVRSAFAQWMGRGRGEAGGRQPAGRPDLRRHAAGPAKNRRQPWKRAPGSRRRRGAMRWPPPRRAPSFRVRGRLCRFARPFECSPSPRPRPLRQSENLSLRRRLTRTNPPHNSCLPLLLPPAPTRPAAAAAAAAATTARPRRWAAAPAT